jgi:hypothetical protein
MAALVDLATAHTDLHPDAVDHLQRLVQWWGVLADFCFSDLLLYAPIAGTESQSFVILGHVRPNTSTTIPSVDWSAKVSVHSWRARGRLRSLSSAA